MKKSLFSLLVVGAFWLSACTLQIPPDLTPTSDTPAAPPSATVAATPSTPEAIATETDTVTETITGTTDTVTATGMVTATDAVTGTDSLTATDTVTATDTMTATDMMTGTSMMTATEAVTLPDTSTMTIAEIVQSVDSLSLFAGAIDAVGMELAFANAGPLTVFAPGNAAFEGVAPEVMDELLADPARLAEILQYHIVVDSVDATQLAQLDSVQTAAGQPITVTIDLNGRLMVNEALIVYADIPAANGVIHVINQILTPSTTNLALPVVNPDLIALRDRPADDTLEQLKRADTSAQTIVEIVKSISGLTTMGTAIDAAGLNDPLQGDGPFTLFVATDPAFRELPDEALEALLNDTEALTALLQYHLVTGVVTSADMEELPTLVNAAGAELSVRVQTNGRIFINGAPVYQADIEAANGIIHVIGGVLLPDN